MRLKTVNDMSSSYHIKYGYFIIHFSSMDYVSIGSSRTWKWSTTPVQNRIWLTVLLRSATRKSSSSELCAGSGSPRLPFRHHESVAAEAGMFLAVRMRCAGIGFDLLPGRRIPNIRHVGRRQISNADRLHGGVLHISIRNSARYAACWYVVDGQVWSPSPQPKLGRSKRHTFLHRIASSRRTSGCHKMRPGVIHTDLTQICSQTGDMRPADGAQCRALRVFGQMGVQLLELYQFS